jgi:predicted nucleic acid-binding Zn ribbon protein
MRKANDEDARWVLSQIRLESRRTAKPIGELVSRLMARRGYAHVRVAQEWVAVWRRVAGELAQRSRPGQYRGGVLEIVVQDSATHQELEFRKQQLISAVRELGAGFQIRNLRFKVGGVSQQRIERNEQ